MSGFSIQSEESVTHRTYSTKQVVHYPMQELAVMSCWVSQPFVPRYRLFTSLPGPDNTTIYYFGGKETIL